MIKYFLQGYIIFLTVSVFGQSVGIGTGSPSDKAVLELSSSDKGLLIPRMSGAARSNIQSPIPVGLMVYQSDGDTGFYYYSGTTWNLVGKGGNYWTKDALSLYTVDHNIGIGSFVPNAKLQIDGGTEANLSDGSGYVIIGNKDARNLVLDDNEIQSRNDEAAAALFLQPEGGNVGIGTGSANVKLKIDGGSDASLSSGGYLQIGTTTDKNIIIDNNEIMARDNGDVSILYLNNSSGKVQVGNDFEITGKMTGNLNLEQLTTTITQDNQSIDVTNASHINLVNNGIPGNAFLSRDFRLSNGTIGQILYIVKHGTANVILNESTNVNLPSAWIVISSGTIVQLIFIGTEWHLVSMTNNG